MRGRPQDGKSIRAAGEVSLVDLGYCHILKPVKVSLPKQLCNLPRVEEEQERFPRRGNTLREGIELHLFIRGSCGSGHTIIQNHARPRWLCRNHIQRL